MLNREMNHKHAAIWSYNINRDVIQQKKNVPIKTSRICFPVNREANLQLEVISPNLEIISKATPSPPTQISLFMPISTTNHAYFYN